MKKSREKLEKLCAVSISIIDVFYGYLSPGDAKVTNRYFNN